MTLNKNSLNIRPYYGIFKMRLIAGMQYRAAAWAGVATQFFWGFMNLMIFSAFYKNPGSAQPMVFSELVQYIWLRQAFLAIIMIWFQDGEILSDISSGNIAYELCRPYSLYSFWYWRFCAQRVANSALRCLPIIAIAFILPAPYNMSLPPNPGAAALFIAALSLSVLLVVSISMFIYILTFITLSPIGSRLIIGVAAEFLAGSVIPVPFMPHFLQSVLSYMPFMYTTDLPFRIYSGNIGIRGAVFGVLIQIVWIAGLNAVGVFAFSRVMRRVVIQGG